MEDKALLPPHDTLPFVHGGDGTGILDHEIVILGGDLNVSRQVANSTDCSIELISVGKVCYPVYRQMI